MSSTTTKNIILSQAKYGQNEGIQVVTLAHTTVHTDSTTEVKVEVPGVDPSTIHVSLENNQIFVHCEKGGLAIPIDPTVDTTKVKADIIWGMLILSIPLPEPPVVRSIKVSVHDTAPAPVKKPAAKAHVATEAE
jgi:HSP20 family molecular chaperone IbpA